MSISAGATAKRREFRDGYRAMDAFVTRQGGDDSTSRRCELYDDLLADAPDSPQRKAVATVCGLLEPDWSEPQGRGEREQRRIEIRAFFRVELQNILLRESTEQRIAELEDHLRRGLLYGPGIGAARTACQHLVLECMRAGLSKAARKHLRTLRFLDWKPSADNPLDRELSLGVPAIVETVLGLGDRQEVADGYTMMREALSAFAAEEDSSRLVAWRKLANKCEIKLGMAQLESHDQGSVCEDIDARLERIREEHPGVYAGAKELLREGRAERGETVADLRTCLRRLLDLPFFTQPPKVPDGHVDIDNLTPDAMAQIVASLNDIYGHDQAKYETIPEALSALAIHRRDLRQQRLEPKHPVNSIPCSGIALQGDPGNGKTSLAKGLAKALGLPCCFVACGDLKLSEDVTGISRGHAGARPGVITEELRRAGSFRVVFVLDELSRANHEVHNALIALLDPNQNAAWRDQYFGLPFDLRDIIWVATTNDFNTLPDALRQRFTLVETENFGRSQKRRYGEQQLQKWTQSIAEFAGYTFSDQVWGSLLDRFTDSGLRFFFRDGIYRTLLGAHGLNLPRGNHAITMSDVARMRRQDRVDRSRFLVEGNEGQEIVLASIARRCLSTLVSVPFLVGDKTWVLVADSERLTLCPREGAERAKQNVMLHIAGEDGRPVLAGETAGAQIALGWNEPFRGTTKLNDLLLRDGSLCVLVHPR